MPELPEVETVVRDIRPRTVGRRIHCVAHASELMVQSTLGPWEDCLCGLRIERLDRHGKWMFFRLSNGATLVMHLGMTGRLGVVAAKEPVPPHTHLRLSLDRGGQELRFSDPRRFGELLLCDPASFEDRFGGDRLGPDALTAKPAEFAARLAKTRRRLKAVLLDQRCIAGVGNIYADESLFEARLDPARPGMDLSREEVDRLHGAIRRVLRLAIRHNGSSIRDYVTGDGVPGEFQNRLRVYGRANLPCKKCSFPIELARSVVVGRATYWCPSCQGGKLAVPQGRSLT